MRYFAIALAVLCVAAAALFIAFRFFLPLLFDGGVVPNGGGSATTTVIAPATTPAGNGPGASLLRPSATNTVPAGPVPSGFKGPTDSPHITGPTSNPPGY